MRIDVMHIMMLVYRSLCFACLFTIAGWSARASAEGKVEYASVAALDGAVARTAEGVAVYQMKEPIPAVLVVRRDGPGEVEVHARLNDVILVRAGRAKVLIGGRVDGNRQTAPDEWRGGTIVSGKTYNLGVGDVLWIPAGLAHQVLVAPGASFSYIVAKTYAPVGSSSPLPP